MDEQRMRVLLESAHSALNNARISLEMAWDELEGAPKPKTAAELDYELDEVTGDFQCKHNGVVNASTMGSEQKVYCPSCQTFFDGQGRIIDG